MTQLEADWNQLVAHVESHASELVLLPEMPFYPWIAAAEDPEEAAWRQAMQAHERWMDRFHQLGAGPVLGTRPVKHSDQRLNEAFIWSHESGYLAAHHKYYLPDEELFWEARWYERGNGEFELAMIGTAAIGFAICTELWFTEHARTYARHGIHLLACPRATERSTVDKWIAGGRAAAVMSGAYCISSNRSGRGSGVDWGGSGWIIDPDGEVLETTSDKRPFVTLDLDLSSAELAKQSYPRNVIE